MGNDKADFSILNRLNFKISPIGIKYFPKPPESLNRLEGKIALCEMLKRAQEGEAFYADVENQACGAGAYVLGQKDIHPRCHNGEYGAALKIFDSPRSGARLYHYIPTVARGIINSVAFAPLDKMEYDPDILLCIADTDQTEILLRAMSYRTGKMWSSKSSPAIGCAWIFVYPYLSGELNYGITGLGHGMKRRNLFPKGNQIIAIPFDQLHLILQSLKEMQWVLPAYQSDGFDFVSKVISELGIE
ncbi:MAG: DUF169 domain-containing protein [Deltaproteobacteria bacterium]|nr:DUF169 domain-containing protein [Deltaproteobacteria bacterium]